MTIFAALATGLLLLAAGAVYKRSSFISPAAGRDFQIAVGPTAKEPEIGLGQQTKG